MQYLNQNYSEFLSKYYDEMNLFTDSNSNMIYNNLQHLYSYCNELKILKYTFIYYFLHKLYITILTFLYTLFSKSSKFLKSQLYRLVLSFIVLSFLYEIIFERNIGNHVHN
ncbi:hypothetical protein RhiirA5_508403 [Rhizophagus irregularis]|uniref:Uncharacterized protein n=1 Tax=Rhizophagus irregularis TaxID=588596 RepID=A0A2N0NBW2_9GLOM|nr:hypothetical protein RhiirA5_508403 [Rhizophagus irregularis]